MNNLIANIMFSKASDAVFATICEAYAHTDELSYLIENELDYLYKHLRYLLCVYVAGHLELIPLGLSITAEHLKMDGNILEKIFNDCIEKLEVISNE